MFMEDRDTPYAALRFAQQHIFASDEPIGPAPPNSPRLSLQKVIEALHDSEINVGMQSFCFCGLQVWIGDELNGIKARGRLEPDRDDRWPDDGAVAFWLHETALRLFSNSNYSRDHGHRPEALMMSGST